MKTSLSPSPSLLSAALAGAFALAVATPDPTQAKEPYAVDPGLVECRLPPQMRSLGQHATYLAAGRQMKLSVAECQQRGGTYEGHGPGSKAGNADPNAPLAVTIGGDAHGAACSLQGTVTGLKSGLLTVRAGPGTNYARVDRLANGAQVYTCDRAGGAGWVGIIWGNGDCGLSASIATPQAYAGNCRSGWVSATYLR
jgi:hypothetical protein